MSPSAEERAALELVRRANVLLPGLYAWAATVLYPAELRGAGVAARVATAAALLLLVSGALLGPRRAALGRALGLHGFVALSVVAWVLLGPLLAVDRLEPTKAAMGGLGWVLFAFGWGASREPEHVPEDDPRVLPGEPLAPRGRLPGGSMAVLAVAVVGATLPLLLAWRVTRSAHALFAHALAVVCAVALVSAGAEVAVRRGRWVAEPVGRRMSHAAASLAALALVLAVGAVELLTN